MSRRKLSVTGIIIIAAILIQIAAILIPRLYPPKIKPKVSRTKADMRTMASAIEAYYADAGRYPGWEGNPPTWSPYSVFTTPIGYINSYPMEQYFNDKRTFCYYSDRKGEWWILWSPGPDMDVDLTTSYLESIYHPGISHHADELLLFAYDPTNGTDSSGDFFRAMLQWPEDERSASGPSDGTDKKLQ